MMGLQTIWLAAIWVSGAAGNAHKLPRLILFTMITGTTVAWMPDLSQSRFIKSITTFFSNDRYTLLLIISIVLIAGTVYASEQRIWGYDEEGNYAAAELVATEGASALFQNYGEMGWLGKQHPPLSPILYGFTLRIFGVGLFQARLLTLFFMIGTGMLTYLIGRELYSRQTGLIAVFILFSFPLFFRLGTVAMVEVPLTFFFSLAIYLTLRLMRSMDGRLVVALGLAVGAGMLTKYTMVFVLPIIAYLVMTKCSFKQAVKLFAVLGVTAVTGLTIWLLFAKQTDFLVMQLETIWSYALLVTTNEYGRMVLFETVTNRLPTSLGVYNLPIIAFGMILIVRRRQPKDWYTLMWIALVWIPLILTLPDHRYFMSTFPALAIVAAEGLKKIPALNKKAVLLSLLYCAGSLYLFVDWSRATWMFVQ
ncbi:MAG: phospholipid carrier-dependent glycosyltransferase [Chloroflexi bacterium]|nr:MAG: phospholipid carrier-dependent glycosyltransferase [Chloroflexota bacterium]